MKHFFHLLVIVHIFAGFLATQARADPSDAEMLLNDGQLEAALNEINAQLDQKPGDPKSRFVQGIILAELGNHDKAIDVFSALTKDYPSLPEPYNNLAVLYAHRGDYPKARDALQAAIQTHPSYSTAHENLGDIYAKMASHAYDRALEENQSNTSARLKLSQIDALFSVTDTASTQMAEPRPLAEPDEPDEPGIVKLTETPSERTVVMADEVPEVLENESAIFDVLKEWSTAWSARDVDGYFSHYSKSFRPRSGVDRKDWMEQRRERFKAVSFIEVEINKLVVDFDSANKARVEFLQTYRADNYQDRVIKILNMKYAQGAWRIEREKFRAP